MTPNYTHLPSSKIATVFQTFAERECKNVSPLYYQLSLDMMEETDLLQLAAHARQGQPIPNLFYGAIHYLLLQSEATELANAYTDQTSLRQLYPSISKRASPGIPIDLIKDFCQRREAEIVALLSQRIVQTNAINRTAYIMPIVSSLFPSDVPINLVDIGTSSGLTLNFDNYQYNYGEGRQWGSSEVKIKSEVLGGTLPSFPTMARVKRKIGIDQNPLDLKDEENGNWLKALIWPDSEERFIRMEAAITAAKTSDVALYKADQPAAFQSIIDTVPKMEGLLVYHTHVLYQFTMAQRQAFRQMLDEVGQYRDFYYLAVEANRVFDGLIDDKPGVKIVLTHYQAGKKMATILGETNGHANWIKWQ